MNVSNLGVGIVIAFAFSWPITLLILGFVPFLSKSFKPIIL